MKNQIPSLPPFYKNENQDRNTWNTEMDVYQNADLIVQTTNRCDKNCPDCYLLKNGIAKKDDLSKEKYESSISQLNEGQIIALRGGEMTIMKDWFEKFVIPALNKKLKIILETNGYFIGTKEYSDILNKIAKNEIFTRISFDPMHLRLKDKNNEFEKMALFAKDAEDNKINFGFYSLDLNKEQIIDFIKNTPLEPYIEKFHSLIKYDNISDVSIKGKYLKSDGSLIDRVEG